jgi:transposase
MSGIRKKHGKAIKFEAAIAILSGNYTMAEPSQKYGVHQVVLYRWKKELLEKGPELFEPKYKNNQSNDKQVDQLQRKIGELTMDLDFFKKKLGI